MIPRRSALQVSLVRSWVLFLLAQTLLPSPQSVFSASGSYSDAEIARVESQPESQIRRARDAELKEIRKLLALRMPENRKADLYVRQAELYFEAYRQEFLLEGRVHDQKVSSGKRSSLLTGRSRQFLVRGIQAAEEILGSGLSIAQKDRLYFMLGYHHSEAGHEKESLKYYQALISEFPKSTFAGEAYRELGEVAFENRDFARARSSFEAALPILKAKAAQDPQAGLAAARVQHKLGWTAYRQKRVDLAIQNLQSSVALSMALGDLGTGIREEALRDLAVFMTEAGRVDDALLYFEKAAGGESAYPKLLEKLGKQYERQVEPIKAVQVYEAILKASPSSDEAIRARARLVEVDLKQGNTTGALVHVGPIQLNAALLSGEVESETSVAARNLRSKLRRTATELHQRARKKSESDSDSSKADYAMAEKFYQVYLERFLSVHDPKTEALEIRMYLAEIKRELGKAKEASDLYVEVIRSEDAKYSKEASALWLGALADGLKTAEKGETRGKRTGSPSAKEREFIDAAHRVQKLLPESREARQGLLQSARIFADYQSTEDDALEEIEVLLQKYPGSEESHTGARLWLQILEDRLPSQAAEIPKSKAASRIRDAIAELRAIPALFTTDQQKQSVLKAKMSSIESRLDLGEVAQNEKKADFKSAAEGYERFARSQSAGSEAATQAYASAVSGYIRAGDFDSAHAVFSRWSAPEAARKSKTSRHAMLAASADLALLGMAKGKSTESAELSASQWKLHRNELSLSEQTELWAQAFRSCVAAGLDAPVLRLLESVPASAAVNSLVVGYYVRTLAEKGISDSRVAAISGALKKLSLSSEQKQQLSQLESEARLPYGAFRNATVAAAAEDLDRAWKKATQGSSFRGKKIKEALDLRLAELDRAQKKLDTISAPTGDEAIELGKLRAERVRVLARELEAQASQPDPIWGEQTVKSLIELQKNFDASAKQLLERLIQTADEKGWVAFELYSLRQESKPYLPVLRFSPIKQEKVQAKEGTVSRLIRNLRDADAWAELGLEAYRLGESEKARWYLERALALRPGISRASLALQSLELDHRSGRLAHLAALEDYVSTQKALQASPSNASELRMWSAYLALRIGLPHASLLALNQLDPADQKDPGARLLRAHALSATEGLEASASEAVSQDAWTESQKSWFGFQRLLSQSARDCASVQGAWASSLSQAEFQAFEFKERIKEVLKDQQKQKGCAR